MGVVQIPSYTILNTTLRCSCTAGDYCTEVGISPLGCHNPPIDDPHGREDEERRRLPWKLGHPILGIRRWQYCICYRPVCSIDIKYRPGYGRLMLPSCCLTFKAHCKYGASPIHPNRQVGLFPCSRRSCCHSNLE